MAQLIDRASPASAAAAPGERWWPSPAGLVARCAVLVLLGVIVIALPWGIPPVYEPVVARAVVYAIIALSMNVLVGYVGQISLGHAAFVGVGAFGAGIVMTDLGLPYFPALIGAALIGAITALILGGVALRVAGMYLALVTIAYHLFVSETLLNIRAFTGGGAGMPVPRPTFAVGNVAFIYFCLGVLAIIWAIDWRLTSTSAGRAIQALRDDERVAASWGINVTAFKLLAFVLSGVIAGLAGALFASIEEIASPVTFRGLELSLDFAIMVFIGGVASRPGAVLGGLLFGAGPTVLDVTSEIWAECTTAWAGGWIQLVWGIPTPGPRLWLLLIGAGIIASGVGLVRRMRGGGPGRAAAHLVGGSALLAVGSLLAVGQLLGFACLWPIFTGSAFRLLAAVLLVAILIAYPGGLAQALSKPLRWLSFRPWNVPERGESFAGVGGGAHVRP